MIGTVLLVAAALVHGNATRRWTALAPAGAAERLHTYVVRLGDYAAEDIPNDMPVKDKSRATSRRYLSGSLNRSAVVTVITGPPGAVSTHTPDVCYPASGYKTFRDPRRETVALPGGGTAGYYVAEFERPTATGPDRQRVRWGWSADGTWAAPARPRFAYLRSPELAKVYIVTPAPDGDGAGPAGDPPDVGRFVAAAFAQYAGLFAGG